MTFLFHMLVGAAAAAAAAPDPVAACRAVYADDLPAYAGCLEEALGARAEQETGTAPDAAAAETGDETSTEPGGAPDNGPSGLGAEQVRKSAQQADEAEEASVRIIGSSYDSAGLGTFRTADGQVWRETTPSPKRRRLDPDRPYDARIVRGRIGGYRMHVEGVRWMKTVRRIE